MRYRVFHRWIFVALCVLSVGLLEWPASTRAQTLGGITVVPPTIPVPVPVPVPVAVSTVLGTGTLAPGSLDSLYSELDSISTSLVSAEVPSARVNSTRSARPWFRQRFQARG